MVELIYAGNAAEAEDYIRMHRLEGKVKVLNDAFALHHATEGTVIHSVGTYWKRHDYGQVSEIAKRKGHVFRG